MPNLIYRLYLLFRFFFLFFLLNVIISKMVGCSKCRIMSCCRIIWITAIVEFHSIFFFCWDAWSHAPCESPEETHSKFCIQIMSIIYWRHTAKRWAFCLFAVFAPLIDLFPFKCMRAFCIYPYCLLFPFFFSSSLLLFVATRLVFGNFNIIIPKNTSLIRAFITTHRIYTMKA